jgi:hypothetical protein
MSSRRKSSGGDWEGAIFTFVFLALPFLVANPDGHHHAGRGVIASLLGSIVGFICYVINDTQK